MFDDESRRRQFLRWTAVAGGVGLAGCNGGGSGDDEEDEAEEEAEDGETDADSTDTEAEADGGTKTDTETESEMGTETEGEPGTSMPQVQFGFEYEGGAVTITHEGGDTVQAGNLEVSSGDETALWSNLAWDFLDWAIPNRERSARMFREHGVFPAYEEAYDSSAFSTSNSEQFLGGQSPGAFFSSVAPDIEGYRYTADEPAISETINDNIFDAITEGGSPQEVMLEAADAAAAETGRNIA